MAKSRVTPLKPVTIPRLDLTAALVSSKISFMLRKELEYTPIEEVVWTDSKMVLATSIMTPEDFLYLLVIAFTETESGHRLDSGTTLERNPIPQT